jgi:prolyl-tRNA editing enzyme YbaK/EbsC (Cys-tRNA(Pro) deacylase)
MNKKLQKILDESKKKHEAIEHRTTYTAYDVAATLHLKLNQIAKSLLVKTNKPLIHGAKPYALIVVPADKNVDLKKLAKIMSTKDLRITKVEIPKEGVMKAQFKVKPGSMAAFGSLYKLPVFVDKVVKGQMIFAAGSFEESIKMKAEDFIKIENAKIGSFSVAKKASKKKKK